MGLNRFAVSFSCPLAIVVLLSAWRGPVGWIVLPLMLWMAYCIWYVWRLSDVWLDGEELQVKALSGSFRVPLSDVVRVDSQIDLLPIVVLTLEHPIGEAKEVRFLPEGRAMRFGPYPADVLVKDLRGRIDAARSARKA